MFTRPPIALTCLVAGVMVLLALSAAGGRGAAELPAAELTLASGGTLDLSNSLDGAAVFSAQGMRPGATAGGTVSVSNTGSVDRSFSLSQANLVDSPGPFGGRLSDHLQLAVEEISGGGSTAQSLYAGALSGLGTRVLGTLRAGETRSYRFAVSFPDIGLAAADNLFQSASLQVDYLWTAVGGETGGGHGGGGGGAGGGGWPGGGAGQGKLTLKLGGKRKQRPLRRRRLVVQVTCSAACRLTPSLRVRKARGLRKLRARRMAVSPGKRKRLTFKLSRRKARVLRRALQRRRRVVAVVKVTALAGGAKVTAKRRIVLTR